MKRFLLALLFLAMLRPAWGHPMPSSAVELRFDQHEIDAELILPISELAMGWEQPLSRDAVQTVRDYVRRSAIICANTSARPRPTGDCGR